MRRLRKLVGWLVLIVLLVYGGSNLWLSSRWGTGVAESSLRERTSMDWEIGGVTWSPWNGVTLSDVKMLQPEALREQISHPVLEVDRMQVQPHWRSLLRGRVRLRDVSIESPRVTVAVEMLAYLSADGVRGEAVPNVVLPVEREPVGLTDKGLADPSDAEVTKGKPEQARQPAIASEGKVRPVPSARPVSSERPPVGLPLHLHIKNASFQLISVNWGGELFQLEGADLELPLLGDDVEGSLSVALLKIQGLGKLTDFQQSISWKRPYLECGNSKVKMGDVEFGYRVQLGIGARASGGKALPFLLDVVLPPQKVDQVKWLKRAPLKVEAEEVAGRFRFSGMLRSPVTWRANMLFLGSKIRVEEAHGGRDISFDEVVVPAVFRQGALQWGGVRLIGEDVSVLGNGRLSVRGGVLSVTRLVVSPEVGKMVSRALHGAGLVRNGTRWWDDLDTPDRKMRDLLVSGSLIEPVIDAGYEYEEFPVWEVVGSTVQFIRNEMKEEKGLGIRN